MKRRTLLILALSMLLVIPALVAAAANGSHTGTPVATANQDRAWTMRRTSLRLAPRSKAQKQLRIHDPAIGEVGAG